MGKCWVWRWVWGKCWVERGYGLVLNEEIAEETFVGSWQTGLSELVRGVKRGE